MATYAAASAAYADVAAALALATVSGDIVTVPAGTETWSTAFNIGAGITLEGAGVDTIITCTVGSPLGTARLFSGSVLKDFRMIGGANPCFGVSTGAQGWRISGITYTSTADNSSFLRSEGSAATYGLIDNCDITGPGGESELIYVRGPVDAWDNPSTMGTDQAVYIEDCIFRGQGYVCDFNANGKGVVRGCTLYGPIKIDAHGLATNSPAKSCRHIEFYDNYWDIGNQFARIVDIRGGTCMAFDNRCRVTLTGSGNLSLVLTDYVHANSAPFENFDYIWRTPLDYPTWMQIGRGQFAIPGDRASGTSEPAYLWSNRRGGALWACSNGAVYAGRTFTTNAALYAVGATQLTFTGSSAIRAGNYISISGQPIPYLVTIGRSSTSAPITISPPLVVEIPAVATTMVYGPIQHYRGQTGNPSASYTQATMIAPNRDYFQEVATFNGSSGVGIGTRAQMDAITPTLAGVGFWVTDEGDWDADADVGESGRLYTWSGSAWVFKYEPYTRPHPLRGALAAPTISVQPTSRTVEEGQNTTFTVSASGNPSPAFQWRKGGVAISGKTANSLAFTNAQTTDAGSYDCVVTNSEGSETSDTVTLTVNPFDGGDLPVITVQPVNITTFEDEDATFSITATGDNTPLYQWYKNGGAISGATSSTLFLSQVTEADEATYYCVVSNASGSVTSNTASLTVDPIPPPAPSGLGNPTAHSSRASLVGISLV
jgi:hypothetical protein